MHTFPPAVYSQAPSNYVTFIVHISTEQLNLIFEGSHFVVRPPTADKCLRFILGQNGNNISKLNLMFIGPCITVIVEE